MPATLSPKRLSPAADEFISRPVAETPTQLTIVLPALNEEDAIAGTLERCLDARQAILAQTPVTHVQVVVVSDGSTDRTAEIAQQYADVRVIVFKRNRGYGAAIKEGWRQMGGDLLAFLDADGTCDPLYFIDLCNLALTDGADIALGSRMGPDSKMPRWILTPNIPGMLFITRVNSGIMPRASSTWVLVPPNSVTRSEAT